MQQECIAVALCKKHSWWSLPRSPAVPTFTATVVTATTFKLQ